MAVWLLHTFVNGTRITPADQREQRGAGSSFLIKMASMSSLGPATCTFSQLSYSVN
jgi:hypothetical protein